LPVLYASGLGSVSRDNYRSLRAVTSDARVRRDGRSVPVIGVASTTRPFSNVPIPPQVMAFEASGEDVTDDDIDALTTGRKGRRFTPVSDYLHDRLREMFRTMIPEDEEYTERFDRLEVFFALIAADARFESIDSRIHLDMPWYGSFTWRHAYSDDPIEQQIQHEFLRFKDLWDPLRAGLFDGSAERAGRAFEYVISEAARLHQNRW